MRRLIVASGFDLRRLAQGPGGAALPGYWLLDTGTMLMRVSAGFRAVLGIGRTSSLPFQSFLEMVHPDDRRRVEALVAPLPPEATTTFDEVIRIVRPDGVVKSVALRGEVETDGAR